MQQKDTLERGRNKEIKMQEEDRRDNGRRSVASCGGSACVELEVEVEVELVGGTTSSSTANIYTKKEKCLKKKPLTSAS